MARTKQTARRSTGGKAPRNSHASQKAHAPQKASRSEENTTEERDSGVEMTSSNDTETMEHSDGSSGAYSSSSESSSETSDSAGSSSSSSSNDEEFNTAELENLAERVEKLESQAKSFTKEASELRALLVKAGLGVLKKEPKKTEAKAPVKKVATKVATKKETKVEPKKPAMLTEKLSEKAISVMTKKDLSAELDMLKVEYKKAALVADLRKLLIKSIKNENKAALVADVKKASEEKETKSKEEKPKKETKKSKEEKKPKKESKKTQEKSEEKETKKDVEEKKIEVQITKDLGYGTDKHGFVYELPTGTVIGQLVNSVPAILSKASIKKLKDLGLKYEVKTASELKKSTKPFTEKKPAVEIESTESAGKKYADDAAEGEETVKKDEDDYIKSSFEDISDSSITKEQFRKVQLALKAGEISVSDPIAEIADKTGLEPTVAGKIMVRFAHFSEQWPEVVSETKPVAVAKGGRTLIKPRNK
mgnify:CR=1 FL=1